LLVAIWPICGYYAHGHILGRFTAEFPDQNHEPFATNWSYTGGPFSLFIEELSIDHDMWLTQGYTCQQRWEAFKRGGSEQLGKNYFVHWGDNFNCRAEDLK
jgi:hypothetical protein